jgi:hypothetical protein
MCSGFVPFIIALPIRKRPLLALPLGPRLYFNRVRSAVAGRGVFQPAKAEICAAPALQTRARS